MSRASGAGSVRTAGERDHICTEAFGDPNAPARRRRSGLAKRAAGSRSDLVKAIRSVLADAEAQEEQRAQLAEQHGVELRDRRLAQVLRRLQTAAFLAGEPIGSGPALDDDALRRARSAGGVSV